MKQRYLIVDSNYCLSKTNLTYASKVNKLFYLKVKYSKINITINFKLIDGFDSAIRNEIVKEGNFKPSNSCMFHPIDLVMKKDHIVYGQADLTRSQDSLVVFN